MNETKLVLDDADFVTGEFTMIHPRLVAKMNGDLDGVYVLSRIHFRCSAQNISEDGKRWWRTTLENLAEELGLSTPQVKRIVKRLTNDNLVLWKVENPHNYDRTRSYRINSVTSQSTKPSFGKDEYVPTKGEKRTYLSTDSSLLLSLKENIEEIQEKNICPPSPKAPDLFDEFWKTYPAKKGKIAAKKAWAKALKETTAEEIIKGAKLYRSDLRVKSGFIKDPSTWLNGGHWSDEPDAPRPTSASAARQSSYKPFQNYADQSIYGDSFR